MQDRRPCSDPQCTYVAKTSIEQHYNYCPLCGCELEEP